MKASCIFLAYLMAVGTGSLLGCGMANDTFWNCLGALIATLLCMMFGFGLTYTITMI